ncbi:multiple sugar transport system permease protein [Paenibacillus methanolicus]|uniref:Multiple sugar transport system permease protein n=1 Tax=Paenibacillus methanolicus TaxID=582686 RepID=A0A5S5CMJ5_9BACL|nr:multiple sugar transport system permease protein [Paenibacillus methanolicus]
MFVYPVEWIPKQWNAIANYKEVWAGDYPFWKYYLNSVKVG